MAEKCFLHQDGSRFGWKLEIKPNRRNLTVIWLKGRRQSMFSSNHEKSINDRDYFSIGLFGANCSGGLAVTTVEERWDASWHNNRALAVMAEQGNFDFLLPIARWLGFGGETSFQRHVLETISWATGLLASTHRIRIFATIHTGFIHPIVAAKQLATADQIAGGRAGLNIVAGWNKPEYEMFGVDLPADHEDRYAYAQEWVDIVERIWSANTASDYSGRFFNLKGLTGDPKPYGGRGRLPIISAGGSPQGQAFATHNADILFTTLADISKESAKILEFKASAARAGRSQLRVFTPAYVVCRPTDKEAIDYHQHYAVDRADTVAVERLLTLTMANARTIPPEVLQHMRMRLAGGHGGLPLVGSPDTVTQQILSLQKAGLDGVALSFVNYLSELPYFMDGVLPRLSEAGVRIQN